jgi:beta-phosphoglucomutase-like phosphatase (HAD superfamily)
MSETTTFDAGLFDMDGVVTDTAAAHAHAWKRLFDEFLSAREYSPDEDLRPFDSDQDYREYVDGNEATSAATRTLQPGALRRFLSEPVVGGLRRLAFAPRRLPSYEA